MSMAPRCRGSHEGHCDELVDRDRHCLEGRVGEVVAGWRRDLDHPVGALEDVLEQAFAVRERRGTCGASLDHLSVLGAGLGLAGGCRRLVPDEVEHRAVEEVGRCRVVGLDDLRYWGGAGARLDVAAEADVDRFGSDEVLQRCG